MKKRVAMILCVAVLIAAVGINSIAVIKAEQAAARTDTVSALTTNKDKLLVSLSALYKRAGDLVLSLPYASITLCETAMMKEFAGDTDAKAYLDARSDDQLANAYSAMEDILNDYDKVMERYGVGPASTHRTSRANLASTFSGLKSASTELVRRARTFINYSDSGYNSYYTSYCDQLQILSERLEAAASTIGNSYDSLVGDVNAMELSFCTAYMQASQAVLAIPYATVNLSQTAVMKLYVGETADDVTIFLKPRVEGDLAAAYTNLDSALSAYDKALSAHSVPSGSDYRAKRVALSGLFTKLKGDSEKLINSMNTLVSSTTSVNYNSYSSRMTALYDTFESVHKQITDEYNALITGLLGSDSQLIF